MDIVVCIKRVPLTQEVDLVIDAGKKDIRKDDLAYILNDWDNYAIEEAVQLKETFDGSVTVVTVGDEEDEEILRRALAMGADRAVRVDPGSQPLDGFVLSGILAAVVKTIPHDLVLTGVQADDDNAGVVGVMLAERLGLSHAAVVTRIEKENGTARLHLELEGGMDAVCQIRFPALLTIQTGINEPRYVSIMGIRKAGKKELKVIELGELGLSDADLLPQTQVEELYLPPETEGAEIIEGDPGAIAETLLRIIREKGVNV